MTETKAEQKLDKKDKAYNIIVSAINEYDENIALLLDERNKLAKAAEDIYNLNQFEQHNIV